jgi:hypothetical protein
MESKLRIVAMQGAPVLEEYCEERSIEGSREVVLGRYRLERLPEAGVELATDLLRPGADDEEGKL